MAKKRTKKQVVPTTKCSDCGLTYVVGAPHYMFCEARTCSECGTTKGSVIPVYDSRVKPPTRLCYDCLNEQLDRDEAES
jgi:hypothetical protein